MPFFSSWIKVIFITALAFSLYSGNCQVFGRVGRKPPNCNEYKGRKLLCSNDVDPICSTNGHTFYNECVFCAVVLDSYKPPVFWRRGKCPK